MRDRDEVPLPPWFKGEEHESKCEIWTDDAIGPRRIFTINCPLGGASPGKLGTLICDVVNAAMVLPKPSRTQIGGKHQPPTGERPSLPPPPVPVYHYPAAMDPMLRRVLERAKDLLDSIPSTVLTRKQVDETVELQILINRYLR